MEALTTRDFTESDEPFGLFAEWFADAQASEPNDPDAMALATVDPDGMPDVRMVLLKSADSSGFVFYSNKQSAKGGQLAATTKAALVLHWKSLRRQVRVRGIITEVAGHEADSYFRTRPRDSRIGAWASQQSRPLESRAALEAAVAHYTGHHAEGEIPRPDYWSGFRIVPVAIEFWADRPFRLHDRIRFTRDGDGWSGARLYP